MITKEDWYQFRNKTIKNLATNHKDNTVTITFTDDTFLKIIVYEDNIDNPLQDNSTFTLQWSEIKLTG